MRSFESCYTKGYVLIDWVGGPAGARGHDVRTERSASWPNSEYFPVRSNQRGVEKFVSTWVGDGWAHAWQPQKRLNNKSQFPLYFRLWAKNSQFIENAIDILSFSYQCLFCGNNAVRHFRKDSCQPVRTFILVSSKNARAGLDGSYTGRNRERNGDMWPG